MGDLNIVPKTGRFGDAVDAINANFDLLDEQMAHFYSAYQVWLQQGHEGTEEDFLRSLTAYGVAVENGYVGTEEQWLASLKGADGVVLDGVSVFSSADALEGKTVAEKEEMVPDGNMVESQQVGLDELTVTVNGGSITQVIDGTKVYSSKGTYYIGKETDASDWYMYNHANVVNYMIPVDDVSRVQGSLYFNGTAKAKICILAWAKQSAWSDAEGYTNVGKLNKYTSWYFLVPDSCIYSKSSTKRTFDLTPPEGAERVFVSYYGKSTVCVINITKSYTMEGLTSRVAALENEEVSISESNTNNDQDCKLLRKHIVDNWSYYLTTPSSPTSYNDMNYLDGKIKNVPRGKHFIFVTDTHWKDNPAKRVNWIASYVQKRLGGCTVIFGGDAVNSASGHGENDKYYAANDLSVYADDFFSCFGDNSLWVCGNHDANYMAVNAGSTTAANGLIDDREIYKRTVGRIDHKVVFDEETIAQWNDKTKINTTDEEDTLTDDLKALGEAWLRLHYHYDDTYRKIRYIIFETGNAGWATRNLIRAGVSYFIPLQFNWLRKVLLSTPSDYDIVILGHEWTMDGGDSDCRNMVKLLNAFKNRTSVSVNMRGTNTTETTKTLTLLLSGQSSSASRTFDFSSSNHTGRVIIVGGHYHKDRIFQFQYNTDWQLARLYPEPETPPTLMEQGILYVAVNTDNATRLQSPRDVTNEGRPTSPTGTIYEICFDVITLTDDNKLVCTRFGWGDDREVDIPIYDV